MKLRILLLVVFPFFYLGVLIAQAPVDTVALRLEADQLLQRGNYLFQNRNLPDSLTVIDKAEQLALSVDGYWSSLHASACHLKASVLFATGNRKDAEKYFLSSHEIQTKLNSKGNPSYARLVHDMGYFYATFQQYTKAEGYFLEALELQKKWFASFPMDYLSTLSNLGMLYSGTDNYQKALAHWTELKDILGHRVGALHPQYKVVQSNIANLHRQFGHYIEAEAELKEILPFWESAGAMFHSEYIRNLQNAAALFFAKGNYEEAEAYHKKVCWAQEKQVGKSSMEYWRAVVSLAIFYSNMGQFQKGLGLFKEVEAVTKPLIGENNIEMAGIQGRIGWLYHEMGFLEEAKARFEKGLDILTLHPGQQLPEYVFLKSNLGKLLHSSGQLFEAEAQYIALLQEVEVQVGKVNTFYVEQLHNLSTVYTSLQLNEKATLVMAQALALEAQVSGALSPSYAKLLWKQAQNRRALGNYPEALVSCKAALKIQEASIGKKHPDYWMTLDELGYLYSVTDQFIKADSLLRFLLSEKIVFYGSESVHVGNTLLSLAILDARMGRWRSAETRYQQALSIFESTNGKGQHNYLRTLENLATLYDKLADFPAAIQAQQEVLQRREEMQGKAHPEYGRAVTALATIYAHAGKLSEAVRVLEQNLFHLEHLNDTSSSTYGSALVTYARILSEVGQLEKSEKIYKKALALVERTKGKQHQDYVATLQNMALFYSLSKHYKKVEPLYLDLLSTLGEDQIALKVSVFKGLSSLYKDLGDNKKAIASLKKAMELENQMQSEDTVKRALNLAEEGYLLKEMGAYELASSSYEQALQLVQHSDGAADQVLPSILSGAGFLMEAVGNFEKGDWYHRKALFAYQQINGGQRKEEYAGLLLNLASNHLSLNQYSEATPLVDEALSILRSPVGQSPHSFYWVALSHKAAVLCFNGAFKEAAEKLDSVQAQSHQEQLSGMQFLSENDLRLLAEKKLRDRLHLFNFLHRSGSSPKFAELCYNELLFQKGFLQLAALRLNHFSDGTPSMDSIRYQLKNIRKQWYELSLLSSPETEVIQILEEKANSLEAQLARKLDGADLSPAQTDWRAIQQTLVQGEAAIEFFQFPIQFPNVVDSIQYAALIILPNHPSPIYISVCEETKLKTALFSNSSHAANGYGWRGLVDSSTINHIGLFPTIWPPLTRALAGVKRVYYAPDGLLHRINFDAIPLDKELYLSDELELVRLSSTRTLVDRPIDEAPTLSTAALFGAVDYDLDTTGYALTARSTSSPSAIHQGQIQTNMESPPVRWSKLSGTQKEIAQLKALMTESQIVVRDYTQKEASEYQLKQLGQKQAAPSILHLATHGFFEKKMDSLVEVGSSSRKKPFWGQVDDPMIRSGLLLAGANYAWNHHQAFQEETEDGVVTAYEISQLNFSNTELVVLSACETGLGDVFRNEGVYGLQRAFKVAGAKNLIISLWKVPDEETSEFMIEFYRHWLIEKDTIHRAFYQTQKFMRGRYTDPNKWAGFILVQ
jgi:CHAT domain-containing protein